MRWVYLPQTDTFRFCNALSDSVKFIALKSFLNRVRKLNHIDRLIPPENFGIFVKSRNFRQIPSLPPLQHPRLTASGPSPGSSRMTRATWWCVCGREMGLSARGFVPGGAERIPISAVVVKRAFRIGVGAISGRARVSKPQD